MSGRKLNLKRFQSVTNGNMASNLTSLVTNIEHLDNIALQLHYTGVPVGVFYVEFSLDYDVDNQGVVRNSGTWVPIDFGSPVAAAGAADDIFFDLNQVAGPWIRMRYAATSGSGTLQAFISGKMV
jgi:hypothetical protein